MIIKFKDFLNEDRMLTTSGVYNGPPIKGNGTADPVLGTNNGRMGGGDVSGDMYKMGDVTAKGDKTTYKYNIKNVKSKESKKRREAIKKIKDLEEDLYDAENETKNN